MAWYRGGSVTVTNGSATIAGAGTDFVANAFAGDAFVGPDVRPYEIARVVSATELTLATPYAGASAGGQPFAIQPTQSYIRDLAQGAASLLTTFATVRDGIGQGLFPDGTAATPAIRFAADEDTGIRRVGANALGVVAGGVQRFSVDADGGLTLTAGPEFLLRVGSPVAGTASGTSKGRLGLFSSATECAAVDFMRGADGATGSVGFRTSGVERARIDADGNLIVGATAGTARVEARVTSSGAFRAQWVDGSEMLRVAGSGSVNGVAGGGNMSGILVVARDTGNGRSLAAAGTLNASGADYAEYMTKAAGCGTIAAGDVCGVDRDGKLARTFADVHSFVVKSTEPAYVGGDSWSAGLPARPEAPGSEPVEPVLPTRPNEEGPKLEAWRVQADAYPAALAAWRAAHAAWVEADAAFHRDLAAWKAALEVERAKVDRIAFCGQVPVNVTGDVAVGDYLVAEADGTGIKAVAIAATAITFDQYRRRLGKVWAIRGDRPWIDVQHG